KPAVNTVSVGLDPLTLAQIKQLPREEELAALDESFEVMMDIEIVAGLCPASEIYVYFAKFDQSGWVHLLNRVIDGDHARPPIVSASWGMAEDHSDWSKGALKEINLRLKAAALMGITVCIASGDDGSGDQIEDGNGHVDFPSSSPYVLSVGGTMIEDDEEIAWWEEPGKRTEDGGGATGGGGTGVFKRPPWQHGVAADTGNDGVLAGPNPA